MANISFGPIVDGVRGSINGVTFSRCFGTTTARARPRPPKPRRPSQTEIQRLTAQASQEWRNQATATQDDWTAYAATVTLTNGLGQEYHPTGFQAYVWHYVNQELMFPTNHSNPAPTQNGLATVPTLTLSYSAHDLIISGWAPPPDNADWMLFSVSRPDNLLAHNRAPIVARTSRVSAEGLPITLAEDIDAGLPVGLAVRTWVFTRVVDLYSRVSTRQAISFDFTVA